MIKINSKLMLASTALVSAVAFSGVAQAAVFSSTDAAATTVAGATTLLLTSGTQGSVASGDVVSTSTNATAITDLGAGAVNTGADVIQTTVDGIILNVNTAVSFGNNANEGAFQAINLNANTTLNLDIGDTISADNTNAAGDVIRLETTKTATLNLHGNLVNTSAGTGDAIFAAADTSITINAAGNITGDVVLGNNTNAINLTNGMTLTGVLTGGTGTDALVIGNAAIGSSVSAVSYVNTAKTTLITGAVTNIESLTVTSGTADFTAAVGDASLATVNISSGATLDLNSTLVATTVTMDGSLTTAGGAITADVNFGSNANVAGAYLMGAAGHTVTTAGNAFSSTLTGGAGADTFTANGSTTVAGNVTAIEAINVNGGTLALAGSLAGVTELNVNSGGTLTVATTAGAASMTVASGGTATITGAATITGNVVVAGTYTQTGASTIAGDLTVSGTYAGAANTAVAGATTITGSLTEAGTFGAAANLTVGSGGTATLNGASTIAGTSLIQGTLTIGDALADASTATGAFNVSSTAVVTLNADLTAITALKIENGAVVDVKSGATLNADTGAASSLKNVTLELADAVNTSGKIDFDTDEVDMNTDKVRLTSAQGVSITDGRTYAGIVNGASASVAFTGTNAVTGNALYKYTWAKNGAAYDLTVNLQNAGVTTLAGAASVGNNTAIATAIDSAALSSLYSDVLAETNTDSVLESLAPDVSGGASAAGIATSVASTGTVSNRLALLRGTDNGRSGMVAGEMMANRGMWLQGFGTTSNQDTRKGVKGYNATAAGLAIGVDTDDMFDGSRVGVAFSYATANVDSDASNNAQTGIDAYQLTAYASHDYANNIYVDATVGYSWNKNDTSRVALGSNYKGEYDSNQFSVSAEVGKSYDWMETKVTPFVGFNYINVGTDNYTETGTGGGALAVKSNDISALLLSFGSDIEWNIEGTDGSTYKPYLRAKYSYDTIADQVQTSSSFIAGGAAFASKGADIAKSTLALGTGVNVITAGGFEFTAAYDLEVKEGFLAHTGSLQARWAF